MSLDLPELAKTIAAHGPVVRVLVAKVEGSVPREVGASMLVWADRDASPSQNSQVGTIGGGVLEFQAAKAARRMLANDTTSRLTLEPLGPALGQCCGGAVTLAYEVITAQSVHALRSSSNTSPYHMRKISAQAADQPPKMLLQQVQRHMATDAPQPTALSAGWLTEPFSHDRQPVWIYGAGHVGRALAQTLAPLPGFDVSLIDMSSDRLPDPLPDHTTALLSPNPADLVARAPKLTHHFVMTHSHPLDLEICHQLLLHPFASAGLIGSDSKWARFRKHLARLGHKPAHISSITCPIGDPALGKHPQAVAIGVAAVLLRQGTIAQSAKDVA